MYLAVVLDVFSRKVVGWAMRSHLLSELVLSALDIAACLDFNAAKAILR